jgi:hypothetical protein
MTIHFHIIDDDKTLRGVVNSAPSPKCYFGTLRHNGEDTTWGLSVTIDKDVVTEKDIENAIGNYIIENCVTEGRNIKVDVFEHTLANHYPEVII